MSSAARVPGAAVASRRWWALGALALAQLMVVLDGTIINIALPSAQQDLGIGDESRHWLVTGYALAFGSLLLLGGRLGDLFGRKPMFVVGLAGFAVASAAGGLAESFPVLLSARVAQGVFGALLAPAALSLLSITFTTRSDRVTAFAIFGAVSSAGGAMGLLLGGVLTEYASWRWCLFVNLPIAALAIAGTALIAKEAAPQRQPLDVPGVFTAAFGLVGVVFGLANAERDGWLATGTLIPIVVGIGLLVTFVLMERRAAFPLLPMRVVLDRNRGSAYLVSLIVNAGLLAVFLFGTYYMSSILQFTPVQTGLAFLPTAAAIAATATVTGSRVGSQFGPRSLVTAGGTVSAVGLALLLRTSTDSAYASDVLPGLIVYGVGLGLIFARLQDAATGGTATQDAGVASAMANTSQQIGGSVGTALLSSIAASAAAAFVAGAASSASLAAEAAVHSYHVAFAVAACFYLICAIVGAAGFRSRPRTSGHMTSKEE